VIERREWGMLDGKRSLRGWRRTVHCTRVYLDLHRLCRPLRFSTQNFHSVDAFWMPMLRLKVIDRSG